MANLGIFLPYKQLSLFKSQSTLQTLKKELRLSMGLLGYHKRA